MSVLSESLEKEVTWMLFMVLSSLVTRHRQASLIFAVRSSRDVEYSVIRQVDCIAFKQPGLHQPDSERPDLRPLAREAAEVFWKIPKESDWLQHSFSMTFSVA